MAIQDDFEHFDVLNPHVYEDLVRLARQLAARGHRRIGMQMLFEVLRWERMLDTVDASGFRLNNNYASRYARAIMDNEPDLRGVFEVRELRSA